MIKDLIGKSAQVSNSNINLNVNIINNSAMDESIFNFQRQKSVFRNVKSPQHTSLTGGCMTGSDILSPVHHSKNNSLGEYFLSKKSKAYYQDEKTKLKSIFFDESGSATK